MARDDDLLIRFRRLDPDGGGGPGDDDWEDYPCPAGFTGPVPIPPGGGYGGGSGGGAGGGGSGGGSAASGVNVSLAAFIGNRRASGGSRATSATNDRERRQELTIRFNADDEEAKCLNWAQLICWKPAPLTYLNLVVTQVQYSGVYDTSEALPTLTGSFDADLGAFVLNKIEQDGEEVTPAIRVMWPNGNLRGYLDLVGVANPWYEVEYRLRDTLPEGEAVPPLWISGPYPAGDSEDEQHNITYGWRIPVRFTLAEGLADPGPDSGAEGLWEYADLTTAETAFKPMNGPGGSIIVAEPPEPGEEPTAPGIDFNEDDLNACGFDPSTSLASEFTLLMEVLPAWGRYTVRGKYFCHDQARDLQGEYGFYRLPSVFNNAPLAKVPVAYLKLKEKDDGYYIMFAFDNNQYNPDVLGWHYVFINNYFIGNTFEATRGNPLLCVAFVSGNFPYDIEKTKNLVLGEQYILKQTFNFPSYSIKKNNIIKFESNDWLASYKFRILSFKNQDTFEVKLETEVTRWEPSEAAF